MFVVIAAHSAVLLLVCTHIFIYEIHDIIMLSSVLDFFREENIPGSTFEWSHGDIFCACVTVLHARRTSFLWPHHSCDGS